jgi:murein DD-endopeptidase MepM/ murein hydrolase activator NlpD
MAIKETELSSLSYFARLNLKKRIQIMQRMGDTQRFKRLFISTLPVLALLFLSLSFSNQILMANPIFEHSEFINPFGKSYKVVVPYFKLEQRKEHYKLSHEKMAIELNDYTPIVAPANALVVKQSEFDNWGVNEQNIELEAESYRFLFEGLDKSRVELNEKVKKGDTIGYSGKTALYPTVKFTVFMYGKSIPPQNVIKF